MRKVSLKELEKMNPTYWFLDFDSTLTKSMNPVLDQLNKKYKTNIKPNEVKSWNFGEVNKNISNKEIEEVFASDYFFDNLEFYDGVREFLKRHENNAVIVTKGTPLNIYKKKLWIDKQGFEKIKYIGLPLYSAKEFINMNLAKSIFIDDVTGNLNSTNAQIKVQFREFKEDNEWNKNWEGLVMDSWI